MKKLPSILLSLFLLFSVTCSFNEKIPNIKLKEVVVKASLRNKIHFNQDNLKDYPEEYILAAITKHECFDNSQITERIFIMEAVWNRVIDNFGNQGTTLTNQLLSPKQFTGLFIYRAKEFCIDLNNPKDRYLIKLAREIIYQNKRIYPKKRIYYWAGINDGSHRKWVLRKKFKTLIQTKNIFA